MNARGPEICKAWKPLRSTSTHCEGQNAARTLPQERHKQQPSVNAQKAATMSSWMKTLQSGANKVGRAPARQSNVAPGTRRRLDGVAATASSAARKGCLQQSHKLHTAICPAWGCYAACNMRARRGGVTSTASTSARRVTHRLTGSLAHRQRSREAQALRRDLAAQGRHQIPKRGLGRDLF